MQENTLQLNPQAKKFEDFKEALKNKNQDLTFQLGIELTKYFFLEEKYDPGIIILSEIINFLDEAQNYHLLELYAHLGYGYFKKTSYKDAQSALSAGLDLAEKLANHECIAYFADQIAIICNIEKDHLLALKYLCIAMTSAHISTSMELYTNFLDKPLNKLICEHIEETESFLVTNRKKENNQAFFKTKKARESAKSTETDELESEQESSPLD